MKKFLVCMMLVVGACGVETGDTTQMSVDPQACPDQECEDNRIDRVSEASESEASSRASSQFPGQTQEEAVIRCGREHGTSVPAYECEVHIGLAGVRIDFVCSLAWRVVNGQLVFVSGRCQANPRIFVPPPSAVDPSACPQESECEDNRIDQAAERSETETQSRANTAYPGSPQSEPRVSCQNRPFDRSVSCDVFVELPLVAINFRCDFFYTIENGALHLNSVSCIANPR